MIKKTLIIGLLLIKLFFLYAPLYAWEKEYTHPALSQEAADVSQIGTYLQHQLGYTDGLNTQLQITDATTPFIQDLIWRGMNQNVTTRSILGWLREGAELEDAYPWQARSQHHFHDPIRVGNAGLDNRTDYPDWEGSPTWSPYFDLRGESALFWIRTGTSSTGYPRNNLDTWQEARNRFYESLRSSSASVREQYMAETFLGLGHILHMIEDMGVPAHTRNDFLFGHYRSAWFDWGNPLEKWVEEQIEANGGQSLWAGDGPVVFDRLAKYFDTDVYAGGYLGDGILPPQDLWGLSECSNYQFLSLSTVFGCIGTLYQFPHPTIGKTTLFLESAPDGLKGYFDGSNYGVTHLARNSYTRYIGARYSLFGPSIDSSITTDDTNVFADYADITIPRTIDYTAGLANYFFRGSIEVSIGCPQGCDPATGTATYDMLITNTSMNSDREQVLKGGAFEFFWEDLSGNRTLANAFTVYTYVEGDPDTTQPWDQDSILPYGEQISAEVTFAVPSCTDIKNYVVVYQGEINDFEHPEDTDSDDTQASACWTKSASYSVPATSYTLLVTEWGGTDEYSECAEYLQSIFDTENPDGYTLAKTPNSSCFDCRWRRMDYHTCPYGSPYCYNSCNVTQIMTLYSPSSDEFCVLMTPFPVAYCGFGPLCNGSYKRCFSRQPAESYDDFWERIFNGGVFGDGSEIDCTEDGCKISAMFAWTDSWIRVFWIPNP